MTAGDMMLPKIESPIQYLYVHHMTDIRKANPTDAKATLGDSVPSITKTLYK